MNGADEVQEVRATLRVTAPTWHRRLMLFAPLPLLIGVVAAWYFGNLGELSSLDKVADAARTLRDSPYAVLYVVAAFVLGSMVFFPITALMGGTALGFDMVHGFVYAYVGALAAASVTYWLGRLVGSDLLQYVRGPKIERFQRQLQAHAFRASTAARLVPVGSFTLLNMLAGSLRVPFGWYLLGNVVGTLPGALVWTLFAEQLAAVAQRPDKTRMTAIAAGVLVVGALWFSWRRRMRRATRQEST